MSTPFMQLYIGDYLRDTQHLTAEQHGAYLLILMSMWTAGGTLPGDPKKLARYAKCSPSRWAKIGAEVIEFFEWDGEVLTNKRLRIELEKASEKSIKRAHAGKLGAQAKALKNNKTPEANAEPLLKHSSEPEPEDIISDEIIPPNPPRGKRATGTRKATTPKAKFVPDDWAPNEKHRSLVAELGLSPQQARTELAKFKDYEFSKPKTDWDKTFSVWLRTAAERLPRNIANVRSSAANAGLQRTIDRQDRFDAGLMEALNRRKDRWGIGGEADLAQPHAPV